MGLLQKFKNQYQQLLPTGRAFRTPKNGVSDKLKTAISENSEFVFKSAKRVLSSILPDNTEFTEDDATRWEERLGMIVSPDVDLEIRKLAIRRKLNHPGNIIARQSRDYLELQLQSAGFEVFVYENTSQTDPSTYFGVGNIDLWEYADESEYGDIEYGNLDLWSDVVANSIEYQKDEYFDIGANLSCTFFICGAIQGQFANVQAIRRDEFRQLILKCKPTQTIAYLGINYV